MENSEKFNGVFSITKKGEKIVWIIIFILMCIITFLQFDGYKYLTEYLTRNELKQKVSLLDKKTQSELYFNWIEVENESKLFRDKSKPLLIRKNPYDLNKTIYVLENSIGDYKNEYYGTEGEILQMKCRVGKEAIEYYKESIKLEKAKIKQDSLNALVLERLNSNPCK